MNHFDLFPFIRRYTCKLPTSIFRTLLIQIKISQNDFSFHILFRIDRLRYLLCVRKKLRSWQNNQRGKENRPIEIIEGTIAIHISFENVKLKAFYVFRLLFLLSFITIGTYCSVDGEFLFIFIPFVIMISAFLSKNVQIIPWLGPTRSQSHY